MKIINLTKYCTAPKTSARIDLRQARRLQSRRGWGSQMANNVCPDCGGIVGPWLIYQVDDSDAYVCPCKDAEEEKEK